MRARGFTEDRSGNFAVIAALAMVPLVGSMGLAIDYSRALSARTVLQDQSDAVALAMAAEGPDSETTAWPAHLTMVEQQHPWIMQAKFTNEWTSPTDYTVTARAEIPLTLTRVLPGIPDQISIDVVSVAQLREPIYVYKPPTVTQLDYEAADYNRIYVYCFNAQDAANEKGNRDAKAYRNGKGKPRTEGRTQMTAVADNAGTTYDFQMPKCGPGEAMSYSLHNVQDARTNPRKWESPSSRDYFTDTQITPTGEQYGFGDLEIVETVLCDSRSECKPRSQGGIIPEGKNRTPQKATEPCGPGKFMYYGWEDRPPGSGWTDKDYDDIRIVIECPTIERTGSELVRLIR